MTIPLSFVADMGTLDDATPGVPSPDGAGHRPVLLTPLIESLQPRPGQTVVDATLGAGGVVAARVLATRRDAASPTVRAGEPPGLQEARAALRMRYANGEISREDYLQGKVELED